MDVKLLFQAIIKFLLGLIFVFLFLFIPAGTLNYWNGWLFIGILFVPMFIVGIILMIINPKLLKKRLDINEKQSEQKWVLLFSGLIFIFGFISAGFDYKFKWMQLPKIVVIISVVLFLIEYILYAEVLRENAYLSRTIKIQENQKVIDTGLYGIVRHPMYSVTVLLFLTMPLVLGSFMSFLLFLFYPFIIAKRIKGEEEILERELDGYKQYKEKVKYKLIPFIW